MSTIVAESGALPRHVHGFKMLGDTLVQPGGRNAQMPGGDQVGRFVESSRECAGAVARRVQNHGLVALDAVEACGGPVFAIRFAIEILETVRAADESDVDVRAGDVVTAQPVAPLIVSALGPRSNLALDIGREYGVVTELR